MPEFALDPIFEKFGAVVDIGTTTLAARLYANDGTLLACAATPNPQRVYGADVISRIEKSLADEREALAQCICGGLDGLLRQMEREAEISSEEVDTVVLTGNTTMLYLLTHRDVTACPMRPLLRTSFLAAGPILRSLRWPPRLPHGSTCPGACRPLWGRISPALW